MPPLLASPHTAPLTQSRRTRAGTFLNPWPSAQPHGLSDFLKWVILERHRNPSRPDPDPSTFLRATPRFALPRAAADQLTITWVGHTTCLIQLGGINILTDPVWSDRVSPVPFAGPKRWVAPAVEFSALPPIDLVVISHDHYDHLDRATVRQLIRTHPSVQWVAPLEVGQWLERRGARVAATLDWWESVSVCSIDLTCTPAQHFSGRTPWKRNDTLWCGWALRASTPPHHTIFFAGDTARHTDFDTITRTLGPFDAALMPIGAYDPRWFMQPVHMNPDDAVDAYLDILRANQDRPCLFVATHWGTFKLTDEPLDEPPALTRAAWRNAALDERWLWIPKHGETWTATA